MDIGGRIRAARKATGLSQDALAKRAGVPLNRVTRIETGVVVDPHYSTLSKIAAGLDMSVGELIEQPTLPLAEAPSGSPSDAETGRAWGMLEGILERVSEAAGAPPREAADVLQAVLTTPHLQEAAEHGELPASIQERYEDALFRLERLLGHIVEGPPAEEEPALEPVGKNLALRWNVEVVAREVTALVLERSRRGEDASAIEAEIKRLLRAA